MSRIRRKSNGSIKNIYVHFAVITLVLTAGLAMFAEGENAKVREQAKAQEDKPEEDAITKAAQGKQANEIEVRDASTLAGSFGDSGGSGIQSHSYAAASAMGDMVGSIGRIGQIPSHVIGQLPAGMSAEEWLALNARRAKANEDEQPTESQINDLVAQSQARAGKASE